jgi:hypothetical protein
MKSCIYLIYDNISLNFSYLLTYSMEQGSSWGTNQFAASQEILRIL